MPHLLPKTACHMAVQAAKAADSEEAARGEAEALQQRLLLLNGKLSDAEDRRRAELAPDILLAQEDVELLHSQLDGERAKAVAAQQEVDDIALKLDTVRGHVFHNRSVSPAAGMLPACSGLHVACGADSTRWPVEWLAVAPRGPYWPAGSLLVARSISSVELPDCR